MRLNDVAYTPNPEQGSYLFNEGIDVWLLQVDRGYKIENQGGQMSAFNDKLLEIVHLVHVF